MLVGMYVVMYVYVYMSICITASYHQPSALEHYVNNNSNQSKSTKNIDGFAGSSRSAGQARCCALPRRRETCSRVCRL